jgi:hypothetical protein
MRLNEIRQYDLESSDDEEIQQDSTSDQSILK